VLRKNEGERQGHLVGLQCRAHQWGAHCSKQAKQGHSMQLSQSIAEKEVHQKSHQADSKE